MSEAVRLETQKPDNRAKLGRSTASRRHLAILISELQSLAWSAVLHGFIPTDTAALPPEITTVWVLARTFEQDRCVVWRMESGAAWENLGVIDPAG